MRSTVVFNSLLPLTAVQLGCLVLNAQHPLQDFFEPLSHTEAQIATSTQNNFTEILDSSRATKLRTYLTRLVSSSYSNEDSSTVQLSTLRATTYQLINSGDWFQKVCKIEATRKWLESAIERGHDVYLVVGFHTLCDAKFAMRIESASHEGGQALVPVGNLVTGGVDGLFGDGVLDVGLGGSHQKSQGHKKSFMAPGEQIYAVQYRKVNFKWFSSRNIDKAFLEADNRWKIFWNARGQETGEDDVVEADIDDDIELETSCEIYGTEDGKEEFMFSSDG